MKRCRHCGYQERGVRFAEKPLIAKKAIAEMEKQIAVCQDIKRSIEKHQRYIHSCDMRTVEYGLINGLEDDQTEYLKTLNKLINFMNEMIREIKAGKVPGWFRYHDFTSVQ